MNLNMKLKGNRPEEDQGGKNRLGSVLHKMKEEIEDEVSKERYLEKFTCRVIQTKCKCLREKNYQSSLGYHNVVYVTQQEENDQSGVWSINPGEVAQGIFRPHKNLFFSSLHIS